MISKNTEVSVVKVDVSENPEHETPSWEDHDHGSPNPQKSLPIEYSVEGSLIYDLFEGNPMIVRRHKRNGEEVDGIMETSPIQSMERLGDAVIVETMNSVYSVEASH